MKLKQLSLFLENHPGQLHAPCAALAEAGIDLFSIALADTARFGILRLITSDWQRAKQVLEAAGRVVNVTEVVPIEVDDHPGGLASALEAIERAGLGVEYMYACTSGRKPGKAAIIFRFEDADRALALVKERGLRVLDAEELL